MQNSENKKKARLDCPSEKVGLHDAEHNQMNEKLKGKLLSISRPAPSFHK